MQKWEYMSYNLPYNDSAKEYCDSVGDQGWELTGTIRKPENAIIVLIFKRPKQ